MTRRGIVGPGGIGAALWLALVAGGGPPVAAPRVALAQDADGLQRARALQAEVLQRYREGRYREAIPGAREALALRERALGPGHVDVADSLHGLADLLRETGDYGQGRPLYERALGIREQALGPAHPLVAATLNGLGVLLFRAGDYAAARPLLERALRIREQALGPAHGAVAASLNDLGVLLYLAGDYAGARPLLERALRIRERALGPSHAFVGMTLMNLGRVHRDSGDYAAARPLLERALRVSEQAGGPAHPSVALSLGHLAHLLVLTGDYAGARPLYDRALRIREQALGPAHPDVATTLGGLGVLLVRTGDYAGARPLYERALAIREAALGPAHRDVAAVLNDYGLLLHVTGDYAGARARYERALRIYEQALGPVHPQVGTTVTHLGRLFRRIGDYAAARPLLERGLRIREQALGPGHPDVAFSLNDLAFLLQLTGAADAAGQLYERALRIREQALGPGHPLVAQTLSSLGSLLAQTGRQAEARPLHERGLRIREQALGPDHPDLVQSLNNLALLSRQLGDLAAARAHYERALPIARRAAIPELRWRVLTGLARTHEVEKRLDEALPLYREAVATLEGLVGQFGDEAQRAQFLQVENRLGPYDALARVLLRLHERDASQGYGGEAWAVLEAKKGRVVADALAAARPRIGDARARQEAERVEAAQQQALALERALREEQEKAPAEQRAERVQGLAVLLAQTKGEYLAQVQAFLARYPQYKARFVDQQTVDPKALAKFADRLPEGTLAVQYFAAPDTLYLFVVAPGGRFQVRSQAVSQEALYGLVRDYRRHLEGAATARLSWAEDGSSVHREKVAPLREVTEKLSALLLGPIAAELGTHRDLVLLPNDLLLYLPIHALTRREADGSVRFLAETHRVSYVTQLELADLLTPSQPAPGALLLAMANPDGSLPAASREVRELLRVRPTATSLEGPQATKERFLSLVAQFPDVHLATHGFLDPERPERSYLLMAGPDDASQRLGVAEIAGLSLARNGLAVLSACETALGEQVPGAALITLAAAFSQAGAQSIVASLWKVNDAATRDFMVTFHRTLGSAGRAAALQQAQLTVLRNPRTAHPYFWAPFILMGAR